MKRLALFLGALALSSCGGKTTPRVDAQPAVGAGIGFAALPDVLRAGEGRAVANAMAEGLRGVLAVVEPRFRPAEPETPGLRREGRCECSEGGCDFSGCGAGEAVVSGALTAEGDTFSFDVELTFPFSGGTVVAQCEGTLTITSNQITGSASCNADLGDDTTLTADILFDVEIEDGCPVGGEIEISAQFESPTGSFSVETEVEFTGSCGDAALDDDDSDSDGDGDSDSEDSTSASNSDGDSMSDSDDDDADGGGNNGHGGDDDADGGP